MALSTPFIHSLSLHDALPIFGEILRVAGRQPVVAGNIGDPLIAVVDSEKPRTYVLELSSFQRSADHRCSRPRRDRKSTRLNSSHLVISYTVFCLKIKTKYKKI